MKLPLFCLLLLTIGYAQRPALLDTICEIPPLPEVEIQAAWGNPVFTRTPYVFSRYSTQVKIPRKYDTYNELIFMSRSDVWMADPSARTGRE